MECSLSFVSCDNSAQDYTRLNVSALSHSGLLTTITWVLHGLGARVQHATLRTADDGFAEDVFWITDQKGNKLSDTAAALLKERLQEFVVYCEPHVDNPQEWCSGNVHVSNLSHPQWTCVTIEGEPARHGFLLQVASALSGCGVLLQEANIQSCPLPSTSSAGASGNGTAARTPVPVAPPGYDFTHGRFFRFLLSDKGGGKLDADRVSALLFTLQTFTGQGHMPLTAPNFNAFITKS